MTFKTGDKVRINAEADYPYNGTEGEVVLIEDLPRDVYDVDAALASPGTKDQIGVWVAPLPEDFIGNLFAAGSPNGKIALNFSEDQLEVVA